MRVSKARGIISTVLIISGLLSLSTGAVLYFLDYGMWLGLTRKFLNDVHAVSGLVMGITVMAHFIVNRRMYVMEMKALLLGNLTKGRNLAGNNNK